MVYQGLIETTVGRRIAELRRYEDALAVRGNEHSVLLSAGTIDDWASADAGSWSAYAFEFRRAAQILARSHTPEDPAPILPMLHACRHTLELQLKTVIDAAQRLAATPPVVHKGHELKPLWKVALPAIEAAWKPEVWLPDEARHANGVIDAFDKIDGSSMTTRYPVDKGGVPYRRSSMLSNFSITDMMTAFERAVDFLETGQLWLEIRIDLRKRGIDE